MLRRDALLLLAASCGARARAAASLARFLEPAQGAAVLVDIQGRSLAGVSNDRVAAAQLVPPGSTLKPFVLSALLGSRQLSLDDSFPCPGALTIGGRSFACSHPPVAAAMRVATALAYSCNCFVAHFAHRFEPGELARHLEHAGLASLTGLMGPAEAAGRIQSAAGPDANQLQALGEERVLVTVAGLAMAYRGLALAAGHPETDAVIGGLEGAVEFGTARLARVAGLQVAGKTGSVFAADGPVAWFAGFAPSRAPEVALAVMLHGRSGGADAAPVAGRIFEAWRARQL